MQVQAQDATQLHLKMKQIKISKTDLTGKEIGTTIQENIDLVQFILQQGNVQACKVDLTNNTLKIALLDAQELAAFLYHPDLVAQLSVMGLELKPLNKLEQGRPKQAQTLSRSGQTHEHTAHHDEGDCNDCGDQDISKDASKLVNEFDYGESTLDLGIGGNSGVNSGGGFNFDETTTSSKDLSPAQMDSLRQLLFSQPKGEEKGDND